MVAFGAFVCGARFGGAALVFGAAFAVLGALLGAVDAGVVDVVDVADQVVVHEVIGVVEIDTAPDSLTDCVS